MSNEFVFVGFGAVAYGLVEIMNKEGLYKKTKFIIIEPRDLKANGRWDVLKNRKPVWVREAVTPENCGELLDPVLNDKATLINLSVDVDSIMLLNKAKQHKALYIDTSLENYEEDGHNEVGNTYAKIKENTLYYRQLLAEREMKGSKQTRVLSFGFNPGTIVEYAKKSLVEYAKLRKPEALYNWKGDYAKLCHDLKCEEILVAEYDSQKTKLKPNIDLFINSWSSIGMQCESVDNSMLNLNNEDIAYYNKEGVKMIRPPEKGSHIRFLPERAMNVFRRCYGVDHEGNVFQYESRLLPHMEIATMGAYLTYKGNSPTIMYCYRPSDVAIESLEFLEKNDYKMLKEDYVMWAKDIEPLGFDSIGALCKFRRDDGEVDMFWGGSVISIEDSKAMGFKSGCTIIQVAGGMNSALKWILRNPTNGLTNPEEIPFEFILKDAKPYMGREFFKLLDV